MKTLPEMIAVMQAFERGEIVEIFYDEEWSAITSPTWAWNQCDYRIAEKPKRKVKLLAMVYSRPSPGGMYELCYSTQERENFIRLPQFDVEIEVDCDE